MQSYLWFFILVDPLRKMASAGLDWDIMNDDIYET